MASASLLSPRVRFRTSTCFFFSPGLAAVAFESSLFSYAGGLANDVEDPGADPCDEVVIKGTGDRLVNVDAALAFTAIG